MEKMLLIDGNLLLFRSFYASKVISKDPGTLGVHLFLNSFFEVFKKENPKYVFFAFDAQGPTKRHEEFKDYKAGRVKAPEELYLQKKIILEVLDSMKLKYFSKLGDEADDLIATISNKYKKINNIVIFSEDRDLLQLVDKNVEVIIKNKDKTINDKYRKINIENFYNVFQYYPYQVVDYKGIAGDNSDNLIGIKGIGPKQAINLLNKYSTLEGIYNNINDLSLKQKELFIVNKEYSLMCKKIATLNTNVEINFKLSDMLISIDNIQSREAINILEKYELKRILNLIFNLKYN